MPLACAARLASSVRTSTSPKAARAISDSALGPTSRATAAGEWPTASIPNACVSSAFSSSPTSGASPGGIHADAGSWVWWLVTTSDVTLNDEMSHGLLNAAQRAADLTALRDDRTPLDVLVIGGGVTGTGGALDAASRGLNVALVERADRAHGTSRWSSKLVHGGLRYLAQGAVGIAMESA